MTGMFGMTISRALLACLVALSAAPALAQTPQFLGTYRDWNVYAFTEDGEKICYMASEPKKQDGNYTRRDNPAVLVTRRPGPQVVDEVSVQPGYSYLDGSEVEVAIASNKFMLFTRGDHGDEAGLLHDRARHLGPQHVLARHLLAARLHGGLRCNDRSLRRIGPEPRCRAKPASCTTRARPPRWVRARHAST
jgi:hypothetical protein